MSFTEKVLLKSLRFTELSHDTEVLNMATEIMTWDCQAKFRSKQSLMLGKQFTFHSKKNVYVYNISAIPCSGVARLENRGKQRSFFCSENFAH